MFILISLQYACHRAHRTISTRLYSAIFNADSLKCAHSCLQDCISAPSSLYHLPLMPNSNTTTPPLPPKG
jgi:hypothetical protein